MTQVPIVANAVRLGRLGKQILLLLGKLLPSGDQSNRRRSTPLLRSSSGTSGQQMTRAGITIVVAMGSTIAPISALNTTSSPCAHLSRLYLAQPSLVLLR
jgi:hypothetical protein